MENFHLSSVSLKVVPTQLLQLFIDPLDSLVGTWTGTGFNQIWRPVNKNTIAPKPLPAGQDRFLELNETIESIVFTEVSKEIANRGLFGQVDINLHGISYVQQVADANVKDANGNPTGIHFEPGMWLTVPPTDSDPVVNTATVTRMATIPHGTTLVAQGTFSTIASAPTFDAIDITPFLIGNPNNKIPFPESTLANATLFRTAAADIPHVTQALLNNPATLLQAGIAGKHISSTTTLKVTTTLPNPPLPSGGGTDNIAFLAGASGKPNAMSVEVDATFWIETISEPGKPDTHQLQYAQRVLLNFNGLSWPHISVGTMMKQ